MRLKIFAGMNRSKMENQPVAGRRKPKVAQLLMEALEGRTLLSLPPGWTNTAIYNASQGASATGTADASNGVFTVSGNGNGFFLGFEYAYTTVTGNFDATMRLTNLTGYSAERTSVAFMVRENTTFNNYRQAADGAWDFTRDNTFPLWLRVQRVGDVLATSRSTDGVNWLPAGSTELGSLNATVNLGIAVTAGGTQTATVDNVNINTSPVLPYTTSWVGNTFGSNNGFVQYGFDAVAIGSTGLIYANCPYDEGGGATSIYGEVGGKPTKITSKLGMNGAIGGGFAVATDATHEYYSVGGSVKRVTLDAATGLPGWWYYGNPAEIYSGGNVHGLAVRSGELYISDTGNNTISVYNTTTLALVRSWSVTRPGPLAFDGNGNLWVIRQYTINGSGQSVDGNGNIIPQAGSNEGDQINAYTSTGTLLTGKTISGTGTNYRPCALAYDATNGRLLVADNGPDQQIKGYTNLGAGTGTPTMSYTFGYQGGVFAGPNPGAVNDPAAGGNARFYHLSSLALDASGNLYVGMTWGGGELRKFNSSGTMLWTLQGLNFVQTAAVDPISDPSGTILQVYTNREHYTVDLSQPAATQSTLTGYTWSNFTPSAIADGINQYAGGDSDSLIVRISGQKFMFVGGTRIYRFNGDLAIPCGNISPGGYNTPGSYWHDTNADGIEQASEVTTYSTGLFMSEQAVDANGNIWYTVGNKIYCNLMTGLDANGIPNYQLDHTGITAPAPLTGVGAVSYDVATDTLFIGGTTLDYPAVTNYPPTGSVRVAVQYKNWMQGNRTASNTIVFPADISVGVDGGGFTLYKLVVAMDVAGQYLFAQTPFSEYSGSGLVYVYDRDRGNLVTVLKPGPEVGGIIGNTDNGCKLHAFKMNNGMYVVSSEDDGYNKTILYEWTPATPATVPAVTPEVQFALTSNQVILNWQTPESGVLTGFNVYRSTSPTGTFTKLNTSGVLTNNTYTDSSVVKGLTYYYKVAAVNAVGEGPLPAATLVQFAPASVTYVKTDTTTLGNWYGVYGSQDYMIFGDKTLLTQGTGIYLSGNWQVGNNTTTSNAWDLQKASNLSQRINAPIYALDSTFAVDINLADGQMHQVALYAQAVGNGIGDTFRITDASTGALLDVQEYRSTNTSTGAYLVFNATGRVRVTMLLNGYSTGLSGIFVDAPATPTSTVFFDPMIDLSRTVPALSTSGWTAGSELYWQVNNDGTRQKATNSSTQYLTWNVPKASTFSSTVLFQPSVIADPTTMLQLFTSPDGTTWTSAGITHNTPTAVAYTNWSYETVSSSAALPAGTNYVRFQVTTNNPDQLQISDISITRTSNAVPTVATAAAASPSTAYGTTVNLSVLGADDGGEGNLIYSWAPIGAYPGEVSFSANGTNAAKNTTATFTVPGSYTLQVSIMDVNSKTVTSSTTVTYYAGAAPTAPSGLSATTVSQTQINLTWTDNSSNETGFKVERATNSGFTANLTLVTTTAANVTSYSNTGLTANTQYYYRVRATNGSGDSANSTAANATTLPNAPAAPSGLSATAISSSQINLAWTDNSGNETGFKVERATDSGFTTNLTLVTTTAANATSYSNTGLAASTTYYYRVRATNTGGDSANSATASATTAASLPAAPSGLSATAVSSSQINLAWTDNSNNETGFKIERATDSGFTANLTLVTTTAANATSYSNTGLAASTTYYYRVRATNTGGDSANSGTASATTSASTGVTQASLAGSFNTIGIYNDSVTFPSNSGLGAGGAALSGTLLGSSATWNSNVFNFGAAGSNDVVSGGSSVVISLPTGQYSSLQMLATAVMGNQANQTFTVTYSDLTTATFTQSVSDWYTPQSYAGESIAVTTAYRNIFDGSRDNRTFYVYGYTFALNSSKTISSITMPNNGNVAVLAIDLVGLQVPAAPSGLSATTSSQTQINLAWTDNSSNETGFKIERATDSGFTANLTLVTTTAANVTSYNNTGLTANTQYYYRVRATNASGDSANSASANATTLPNAPTAPSGLTATAVSSSQINLTWTDNSSNETGFKVERATDSGFTTNLTLVTTTAANATSYSNTGLTAGTTYYYRVRATNTGGDSANSASANATTQASIPAPWTSSDIGAVGLAGSASYSAGTFTLTASGADIWNNADEFRFVYQSLTGDGQIVARVASFSGSNPWAKAGVMIRESLAVGATHASTEITIGNGLVLQYRATTDGASSSVAGAAVTAPIWVKMVRSGNTFTSSSSSDGTTWTTIGSTTITMTSTVYIGIIDCSHDDASIATATLDNVAVTNTPSAPSGLSATTLSQTQINLAWTDNSNNETGFKIERATDSGFTTNLTLVTTTSANAVTYSNTGLTANTQYYYRVRATNAGGDSANSASTNATTLPNAPSAPSGLSATTLSQTQINLAWTDNSTNETGFKVERATNSGFTTNLTLVTTTAANATSYSNTGLTANTLYYYRVRATNTGGDSANSASANATTLLNAPTGLAATAASTTQINLSWTALSGATSYSIYRSTTPGGEGSTPIVTGIATASYSNTGLTAGTMYYYKVAAVNAGGTGAQSAEASAITVPAQATGLTATSASSSQINLAWTAVTGAATYNVYRATTAGGEGTTPIATGIATNSYSNTGLTANTTYYYKVAAVNAGGTGAQSTEASATTAALVPTAPSGLIAIAYSSSQINLAWSDNSSNETGFKVERATNSGFTANLTLVTTTSANVTSYSDSTVAAGTTYYYRVRATNASGDSTNTSTASATTLAALPTAPSGLSAVAASNTQINLAWTDNASNETGYKVERATDSGFTANLTLVTTTSANVTSYSNTGLTANTTYYYRVRATNASGDSANSATASVATLQYPVTSATYLRTDTTTTGSWKGNYGTQGYMVIGDTTSLPAWATVTLGGTYENASAVTTTNAGDLQKANSTTDHIYAPIYSFGTWNVDITITDGLTHQIALYVQPGHSNGMGDVFSMTNLNTGTLLTVQEIRSFDTSKGSYLVFNASGAVRVSVSTNSYNSNLSGVFIDPAGTVGNTQFYDPMADLSRTHAATSSTGWQVGPEPGWQLNGDYTRMEATTSTAQYLSWNVPNATAFSTTVNFNPGVIADPTASALQLFTSPDGTTWTAASITHNTPTVISGNWSYETVSNTSALPAGTNYVRLQVSTSSPSYLELGDVTITTPALPVAPTNLTATPGSQGQVNLAWTDNAGIETGYKVERATNSGFTTNLTLVATTAANVTSYSDTTVTAGTTYYYRVRATNGAGDGANSATATVTTLAAVKLNGLVIGTSGATYSTGNGAANAFDGSTTTFVDSTATTGWIGLDLGNARTINLVKYAPRSGQEARMVGGYFQVSNVADFSTATTIYTIGSTPTAGSLTSASVSVSGTFRYIRYVGPASSYVNLAELEFWGF